MSFDEKITAHLEGRGWKREIAGDDDFNAAVNAVKKMHETGLGIIVAGEYGAGKTSLIKAICPRSYYVRLAIATDKLTPEYQALFCDDPFTQNVWLDDLGAEARINSYGVKLNLASDFIVQWHELHQPGTRLYITTNLNVDEIDERYGGRVLSRLKDLCIPLRLKGKDKREWKL